MKKIIYTIVLMVSLLMGGFMNVENYKDTILQSTVDRYYRVEPEIYYASDAYNVPFDIIAAILFTESRFNDNAVSSTGVTGIVQCTSALAKQYDVDKNTVSGQIYGLSRILRDKFDNLPDYYTDEDKWMICVVIWNSGKGNKKTGYWAAKRHYKSLGFTGSDITVKRILKFYRKEGRDYYQKILDARQMFKE